MATRAMRRKERERLEETPSVAEPVAGNVDTGDVGVVDVNVAFPVPVAGGAVGAVALATNVGMYVDVVATVAVLEKTKGVTNVVVTELDALAVMVAPSPTVTLPVPVAVAELVNVPRTAVEKDVVEDPVADEDVDEAVLLETLECVG